MSLVFWLSCTFWWMSSRSGVTSVLFIFSRAFILELWKLCTMERSLLKIWWRFGFQVPFIRIFRGKSSFFVLFVVRNSGLDPVRDFMVFLSMYFYKQLVCCLTFHVLGIFMSKGNISYYWIYCRYSLSNFWWRLHTLKWVLIVMIFFVMDCEFSFGSDSFPTIFASGD